MIWGKPTIFGNTHVSCQKSTSAENFDHFVEEKKLIFTGPIVIGEKPKFGILRIGIGVLRTI